MDAEKAKTISKFLSLVLRHEPQAIGITLDSAGWVQTSILINAMAAHGKQISFDELLHVVETNDKKRFAFNQDRSKIRASQGHSVDVNLGYAPVTPPETLYHGTVDRFLLSIRVSGIQKGQRSHVHLSLDVSTASKVGQRRGKPVILIIRSGEMHRDGYLFYLSDNMVWLTDQVPPKYIDFPK